MIELRPVRTAGDRDAYVAVRNAIHPDTPISIAAHFSETRQDDRADLLAYLDGQPVGTATGRRHFEDRESPFAIVSVRVLREARRRGVGSALFAAISEHAHSIGRTGLYTVVRLDDADSNDYLGKRGFEEVLRIEEVSLPLAGAHPDTTPPDGVAIVPFETDLDERVHPVAVEVDRDIPTAVPIAPLALDAWRDRVLGPGVLRELSFVALAGDEVVGYAVLGEDEPGVAADWFTGVRRDWRGRGLGRALKAAQVDYYDSADELSRTRQIVGALTGPLVSAACSVGMFGLAASLENPWRPFAFASAYLAAFQFAVTIIPFTYPRWWSDYGGRPSDGLRALRLLQGAASATDDGPSRLESADERGPRP